HAASAEQRRICGVHDGIGGFFCDVGRAVEFDHLVIAQDQAHCVVGHAGNHFLSLSASTPGSFLPSKNSSDAPPPVEICVILSATPDWWTAATESPPPTMEVAVRLPATAWAILMVPLANGATSKTPIGPFQTMVLAPAI